jgi:hypothetical protein
MAVIFFVNAQPKGVHIQLSASVANHLMTALAYDLETMAEAPRLFPQDLIPRIRTVRRQLAMGHGREFTSDEINEEQLLVYCDGLERLAENARKCETTITLL